MKRFIFASIMALTAITVQAKDTDYFLSIEQAMEKTKAHKNYNDEIAVYFSHENHSEVERLFEEMIADPGSVAFLQATEDVCQKAFKDAIVTLQKKAIRIGAKAIVNVHSRYEGKLSDDPSQFQCVIGSVMGTVSLYGELVTF